MMALESIVDHALRIFFAANADMFGKKSTYLDFEPDITYVGSEGLKSRFKYGRIVYKKEDNTSHASAPLAIKYTPNYFFLPVLVTFEFTNEIFFYIQLLPFFSSIGDISSLFPKFYHSELSLNLNSFDAAIIFENIQALGYKHAASGLFADYDHLTLMMRRLGQFHAYSYAAKKANLNQFCALASSFTEAHFAKDWKLRYFLSTSALHGLRGLRNDLQYSSRVPELERLAEKADEFLLNVLESDKSNPFAVLCHGDYLQHNILFKYDEGKPVDMKMVDLATCKLASPVVDLAQLLYINANQQMRDEHWDDLINEYYTALKNTFPDVEVPSKDTIMNEFKTKVFFGYIVASFFVARKLQEENNLPSFLDLLPEQYGKISFADIPPEIIQQSTANWGGDLAANALANILKDMMNRGFL